jgi:hypothetical protein
MKESVDPYTLYLTILSEFTMKAFEAESHKRESTSGWAVPPKVDSVVNWINMA